jgi:DnaK suppressor protein
MFDGLKKQLLNEKENIEKELAAYKSEDPLLDPEQTISKTFDDVITVAEGHDRIVATRMELKRRWTEVENALRRFEKGSYGICENCGEKISPERLAILLTAKLCLKCENSQ